MTDVKLPRHLAIIMDGNGRWARCKSKPRGYGHIRGTRVAKNIILDCSRLGIKYLTLYAFSTENWLRPQSEVFLLMKILKKYLARETKNLLKENIKLSVIGDIEKLPNDVKKSLVYSMKETADCTGLNLIFAISYGSRQEIKNAVQNIAREITEGTIKLVDIDEALISSRLSSYPCPDPDLIIRTSGENRISNFLLWQAAYSELYFSDKMWPDFTKETLLTALQSYTQRQRRFGTTGEQSEQLLG